MVIRGRYGVALTFRAPIVKAGGDDLAVSADWTPAAGDVKVSKDGGNVANVTTLPSAVGGTGSALWSWPLSATEMEAQEVLVQVVDAATKAVKDQAFRITTLPDGAIATGKASAGAATSITLATGLPIADGNAIVQIHHGTGAGQSRFILAYNSGTGVATISSGDTDWATNPDNTSCYTVFPSPVSGALVLADGSLTTDKFANGFLTGALISDGAITASKFADGAEPSSVPGHTAKLLEKLDYLFAFVVNKVTFNKDTGARALRNAADSDDISTRTDANDGTTYTKGAES